MRVPPRVFCILWSGVLLSFRVTEARTVTTDLMSIHIRTASTTVLPWFFYVGIISGLFHRYSRQVADYLRWNGVF